MKDNNFWQTEKGKATIKLGLWMVFIAILIVVVLVSERDSINLPVEDDSTPSETETENYEFVNYSDMLDKLLLGNYEYSYTITNETGKYIYTGWKNENKEIGFKEDSTGVIKYYIDDSGTYKVNMDILEVIDYLYNGVDTSYLDLELLFGNLNEFLYSVTKNEDMRTITYDKSGYQVEVMTDTRDITNITISTDTTTYDLNFTKIGECDTIDFNV